MSTRSRETVFWLTLVDFLLQIALLAVFGFAAYLVASNTVKPSAYTELTDKLTRLVPADQIDSLNEGIALLIKYYQAAGYSTLMPFVEELERVIPAETYRSLLTAIQKAGGIQKVLTLLERVDESGGADKVLGGLGRPPCLPTPGAKRPYDALARVRISDTEIRFLEPTEKLNGVLKSLGLQYRQVQALSPDEFRRVFSRLKVVESTCVYYLDIEENYTLRGPREAVETAFHFGSRQSIK